MVEKGAKSTRPCIIQLATVSPGCTRAENTTPRRRARESGSALRGKQISVGVGGLGGCVSKWFHTAAGGNPRVSRTKGGRGEGRGMMQPDAFAPPGRPERKTKESIRTEHFRA